MKPITITKVVSKNFIMDIVASFQNMVGFNLTGYEKMVQKGMDQIQSDLDSRKIKLSWYRYEITQLTSGAVSITLYGDQE
ncbi:hypothetical protein LCGC14_1129330 [marine sediment metagenome]|uniref:Uncharacterized protein n=1 Tax=marine sediment metagenome TaxID=412755 RepID=A0A0F9M1P2_9ZZZZ